MLVMKFGGTSVGDPACIARAAALAVKAAAHGKPVVVVTSAMSGVTNHLIKAAQQAANGEWRSDVRDRLFKRHKEVADQVAADDPARHDSLLQSLMERLDRLEKLCFGLSMVHELTPRLLDAISGTGEMLAAPLLASAIVREGRNSVAVDATALIVTTDQSGAAEPLMEQTRAKTRAKLRQWTGHGTIPVVTGFIGATTDGVLTTLGRGSSDYSASILGAALYAEEVWIWT